MRSVPVYVNGIYSNPEAWGFLTKVGTGQFHLVTRDHLLFSRNLQILSNGDSIQKEQLCQQQKRFRNDFLSFLQTLKSLILLFKMMQTKNLFKVFGSATQHS